MIGQRRFLHCSLCASGSLLLGCDGAPFADDGGAASCDDVLRGGTMLGVVPFVGETLSFETRIGEGWDGRLYTDLSRIEPGTRAYLAITTEGHEVPVSRQAARGLRRRFGLG